MRVAEKCQYNLNACLLKILITMLISPCDPKRKTNSAHIYTGKIYHTIRIRNINTVTLRDISQITLNMCLVAGTFYQDITPLSLSQLHTKGAYTYFCIPSIISDLQQHNIYNYILCLHFGTAIIRYKHFNQTMSQAPPKFSKSYSTYKI